LPRAVPLHGQDAQDAGATVRSNRARSFIGRRYNAGMIYHTAIAFFPPTGRGLGRTTRVLRRALRKKNLQSLSTCERQFPVRVRADLQRALEEFFAEGRDRPALLSVRQDMSFTGIGFAGLVTAGLGCARR